MARASLVSFQKQKQGQKRLWIRFARSRCEFQHGNVNFLGFKSLKSGFSEGRMVEYGSLRSQTLAL